MKKKVVRSVALIMAMVLCVGMTAFAKQTKSPGTSDAVIKNVVSAKDSAGRNLSKGDIRVVVGPVKDADKAVADKIKTPEGLKDAIAQSGISNKVNWVVADVVNVNLAGSGSQKGKTPEQLKSKLKWPLTISFKMAGVTPKSTVQILVWVESEKKWVKVKTTAGDGIITGVFDYLGPVAFLVDPATLENGNLSPKTSASNATGVALLGLFAVVVLSSMKKRSLA